MSIQSDVIKVVSNKQPILCSLGSTTRYKYRLWKLFRKSK